MGFFRTVMKVGGQEKMTEREFDKLSLDDKCTIICKSIENASFFNSAKYDKDAHTLSFFVPDCASQGWHRYKVKDLHDVDRIICYLGIGAFFYELEGEDY